jgi:flagellar basal-body rod protein FlgC
MAFLESLDVSASALTAQRLRMDVISENIANIDTTRTADGQPYRRRYVIFQEKEAQPFSFYFDSSSAGASGGGVRVSEIAEDESEFQLKYDPTHPDADEYGYVSMPNVDLATEMVDMMSATRSYEANVTAVNATKSMAMAAMDIGK